MTSAIANGTRVCVLPTHWNASRHGAAGRTVSATTSADDLPTHWVTFDAGGGEFVHAVDLAARAPVVCAWCPGFVPGDLANANVTHGLCAGCAARLEAQGEQTR